MHILSKERSDRKSGQGLIRTSDLGLTDPAEFLLLREMTHRINNELTSAISFASVIASRSHNGDVKIALASMIEHLFDHARVYRALQMPAENKWVDATAYLRELCQSISCAKLRHNSIELVLVEHQIRLTIELKKRGSSAECRITDDGSSSDIVRSGHGLKIVKHLAIALDGAIDLRFGEDGAIATVSFRIAEPI